MEYVPYLYLFVLTGTDFSENPCDRVLSFFMASSGANSPKKYQENNREIDNILKSTSDDASQPQIVEPFPMTKARHLYSCVAFTGLCRGEATDEDVAIIKRLSKNGKYDKNDLIKRLGWIIDVSDCLRTERPEQITKELSNIVGLMNGVRSEYYKGTFAGKLDDADEIVLALEHFEMLVGRIKKMVMRKNPAAYW